MLRVSFRRALAYVIVGLLVGALLPLALNWESPLLAIPFCEGLSAFALAAGRRLSFARNQMASAPPQTRGFGNGLSHVRAPQHPPSTARGGDRTGADSLSQRSPVANDSNPKETKVYVPKSVYLDLMKRVKPEKKDPVVDAPRTLDPKPAIVPVALGNAEYELIVDEKSYFHQRHA